AYHRLTHRRGSLRRDRTGSRLTDVKPNRPNQTWPKQAWPKQAWPKQVWPKQVWPKQVWPKQVWRVAARDQVVVVRVLPPTTRCAAALGSAGGAGSLPVVRRPVVSRRRSKLRRDLLQRASLRGGL